MIERTCEWCGEVFTVKYPSSKGRFCGKSHAASYKHRNGVLPGWKSANTSRVRVGESNSNWRGGSRDHPLVNTYGGMLRRCYDQKSPSWEWYGGRGIMVCDRWRAAPDENTAD